MPLKKLHAKFNIIYYDVRSSLGQLLPGMRREKDENGKQINQNFILNFIRRAGYMHLKNIPKKGQNKITVLK